MPCVSWLCTNECRNGISELNCERKVKCKLSLTVAANAANGTMCVTENASSVIKLNLVFGDEQTSDV